MQEELFALVEEMNPWLKGEKIISSETYIPRFQLEKLLLKDWDPLWLILVGPRQAGKTTLGKHLGHELIKAKRYKSFFYLNCDFVEIRRWIKSPLFIREAMKEFQLEEPIFFLDEVQRLENPGLLLKGIVDLKLGVKLMASGSSQLEIKSHVQEFLTGRHLEATILPLNYQEIGEVNRTQLVYGCYPQVVLSQQKEILLKQLYQDYITKDIIEILKIGKPDVMQQLITLLAHSSGQLVNYQQLASDCRISAPTVQHYCGVLEQTYTIAKVKPFVGNKRKEVISNPIYYFIDNGFRNQALRRFSTRDERPDMGLLVEGAVFQEIQKFKTHFFYDFDIHYWRTLSGAEVDFVLYKTEGELVPIEVKYRSMQRPMVTRALRSFIMAYHPEVAFVITKNFSGELEVENCIVYFIAFSRLGKMFPLIEEVFNL